ncbi:MAG: sigma-54 interaction domain-containing protein [Clostridia bacterium]
MGKKEDLPELSQKDLKRIMDHSHDEIFVVDKECRIIYVNDACKRTYGGSPDKIIGKTVWEMVEEGYYSPPLAPIVMERKQTVTLEQITCYGIKLLVTATPIFDDDGEISMVVMNSRDITELEQLKYDVEETKKLLGHYEEEIRTMRQDELALAGIVTQEPAVTACYELAKKVSKTDANILILGESGVGKNLLAGYIHRVSNRRNKPFVQINCAAIPENLLESELFGYCKGAFSGAERGGKMGLVEVADKGTLFLDEIGELPLMLQAKLLQLVQEKTFLPVGGKELKRVDVRIVTATNQNLGQMVKLKKFREDLYYRLNVIEITLPPLRERQNDIPSLVDHLLAKINSQYKSYGVVDPNIIPILQKYSWPGNIRELEHLLERLVLTVDNDIISEKHLPPHIIEEVNRAGAVLTPHDAAEKKIPSKTSYREIEIEQILSLYKELRSSYKVAEQLHISQSKATRIINKYLKNKSDHE